VLVLCAARTSVPSHSMRQSLHAHSMREQGLPHAHRMPACSPACPSCMREQAALHCSVSQRDAIRCTSGVHALHAALLASGRLYNTCIHAKTRPTCSKSRRNATRFRPSVAPRAPLRLACLQHTSPYVSVCLQHTSAYVIIRHTSAYVSIRQHTSAHVSICQHTPAYVSMQRDFGGG
jgi:hypothetical protein